MTDLIICLIVFLAAGGTVTVSEVRLYLARRPETARISAEFNYAVTEAKIERKALALRFHLTPEDTAFLIKNGWEAPPDVKLALKAKQPPPAPLEGEIVGFYTPGKPYFNPRTGRTHP